MSVRNASTASARTLLKVSLRNRNKGIIVMAIATVVRTFDKVALTLFNTAVLGGLPLVAAALVASSFAG